MSGNDYIPVDEFVDKNKNKALPNNQKGINNNPTKKPTIERKSSNNGIFNDERWKSDINNNEFSFFRNLKEMYLFLFPGIDDSCILITFIIIVILILIYIKKK